MDVRVGYLPNPYSLDVAYVGSRPVGTVEKIVMDEPNLDLLGPYIRSVLRGRFSAELQEVGEGSSGLEEC